MLSAGAYSFRQKSRLAISLSWVAGYTNVIAFVMLGKIVVSHVTGNVTHFGLAAAEAMEQTPGAWSQIGFFGLIVFSFFAGAVSSAIMTETARRRGVASKYMLPMAVEALLLVSLAIGVSLHLSGYLSIQSSVHHYWMTTVASAAMGLQNATITRISGAVIRTTHLTGVTTDLGLESVQYILWAWDRSRRPAGKNGTAAAGPASRLARVWKVSRRQPSFQRILLLASVIGSFLFGATAGPIVFFHYPNLALAAPVLFLLWIIYVDWRKPIADVKELDLTADREFGGEGLVREMLPEGVGIYRLVHRRRDAQHSPPDFEAWLERLPKHWRVIILAVSPLTRFDPDSALNLTTALQKLRSQGRNLILLGVKPAQYKILYQAGLIDVLGQQNVAADVELAVARAYNCLDEMQNAKSGMQNGARQSARIHSAFPILHSAFGRYCGIVPTIVAGLDVWLGTAIGEGAAVSIRSSSASST